MNRVAIAAAMAVAWSMSAYAEPLYSTVYVFGDSISDRGRIPAILLAQDPNFPILPPVSPPYFDHRFSNGPTWAERLPGLIGVAPNTQQNRAVGGAETGTDNLLNPVLTSFNVVLPGMRTEINNYLAAGHRFESTALVTHFGGANDFFAFLDQTTPPTLADVPAEIAEINANIESNIRALVAAGARTILVPNVPDLAVTPAYRGTPLAEIAAVLSTQLAADLNANMGVLAQELGVEIVVADFATGLQTLVANPALFGITNDTDACVTSTTSLPASVTPGTPCANPDEHLFWDDVHPTSTGHQLLAEYAADTLLAPATIAAQASVALTSGDAFLRRMQDSLFAAGAANHGASSLSGAPARGNVFFNVRHAFGDGDPGKHAVGFDFDVTQISGGVIVEPWHNVRLGVIGGYDDGEADLDGGRGSIDFTSYRVGAMGGFDDGALFAGAGIAVSSDDYDLERQTFVPVLRSDANTDGHSFKAFGSGGYRFDLGPITAGPLFALRYTRVEIDGYREHGAPGLDMIVDSLTAEQLIGSAGIATAADFPVNSMIVSPYLNLALEGDLLDDDRSIGTALVTVPDVGRTFRVEGDGGLYGRLQGGIAVELTPGVTVTLDGETTIGRDGGDEHAIFGTVRVRL